MKIFILFVLIYAGVCSLFAMNPNDHTTLMNENVKASARTVPDDEEDVYFILTGEAEKAIAEKDYYTAAMRLKDAMTVDPENPSNVLLLSNLGLVYAYLNEDSLALAAYNEALDKAPSMVTVLQNRAKLKLKMGRDVDAYHDFAKVLQRDSLNADARYYHGLISLYAGDEKGATADFNVLESVEPEGYNTYVALSTLYSLTARDREAIPYYKKLIELDSSPEYYSALAGCYLAIGDLSNASAAISEGLERWDDDPELYYYRAWLNRDSYLLDDARRDAQKAISLGADTNRVKALFTSSGQDFSR